jgi:hypothetical protein
VHQARCEFDNDATFPTQSGGDDLRGQTARGLDERVSTVEHAVEHSTQFRARRAGRQRFDADPFSGEIRHWQIDPVEQAIVIGAILQMVEHLQRRTERVGGGPCLAALTVKIEQLPSDRRSRVATIRHQIVPAVVAQLHRILAKRAQHVVAVPRGHPRLDQASTHCLSGRGIFTRRTIEDGGHAIEAANLFIGSQRRVIGDIVGVSGKPVKGVHVRPQVAADQQGADRKIFCAAPFARRRFDAASRFVP